MVRASPEVRHYTIHLLIGGTGSFVRIADNEVSVAHPDAVRLLLHANIAKVCSRSNLSPYAIHHAKSTRDRGTQSLACQTIIM